MAEKVMHPAASRMYLDSCLHLFLKSVYVRMPMLRLFRALATLPDPGPVHWIRTSQNSFFEAPFCFCFLTLASNHNHNCTPSLKEDTSDYRNTSDSALLPTCQSVLAGGGSAGAVARRWPMTRAVVFKTWPADSNWDEMEEMHQNNNYSYKLN